MEIQDSNKKSIYRGHSLFEDLIKMAINAIPYFRGTFPHRQRDWEITLEYLKGMTIQDLSTKYDISIERIRSVITHCIGSMGYFRIEECDVVRVPENNSKLLYETVLKQKALIEELTAKLEQRDPNPAQDVPNEVYTTTIDEVDMSTRLRNVLKWSKDVNTIYEMSLLTLEDLKKTRNCGNPTLEEAVLVLSRYNLSFRKEI